MAQALPSACDRVWRAAMPPRIFLPVCLLAGISFAAPPDGAALYKQRCATCHDGAPQARTPSRSELAARTPEAIYKAMFEGAMVPQSAGLSAEEGRAIARYLTAKEFSSAGTALAGQDRKSTRL